MQLPPADTRNRDAGDSREDPQVRVSAASQNKWSIGMQHHTGYFCLPLTASDKKIYSNFVLNHCDFPDFNRTVCFRWGFAVRTTKLHHKFKDSKLPYGWILRIIMVWSFGRTVIMLVKDEQFAKWIWISNSNQHSSTIRHHNGVARTSGCGGWIFFASLPVGVGVPHIPSL